VSSHSGLNLTYPPVIRNVVLLQSGLKGMYVGKLEMMFYGSELLFYNTTTKRQLENNLVSIRNRLSAPNTPESQKAQLRKNQEETEKRLVEFRGKNEFTNTLMPVTDQMKDHPEVLKRVEAYRSKFPETAPAPSVESPAPKAGIPATPKK